MNIIRMINLLLAWGSEMLEYVDAMPVVNHLLLKAIKYILKPNKTN